MMTTFVYVLTSFTLAIVLVLARSSGHEVGKGLETFKYQAGLLRIVLWGSPVPLFLMVCVYLVTTPAMSNLSLALLLMMGVVGSSLVFYAYRYLDSLRVEVSRSGVRILTLRSSRYIDFDKISRVDFVEGDKGVLFLDIFSGAKERVARLASTLQDFDDLHRLIEVAATRSGATYRRRDKWGKWSS